MIPSGYKEDTVYSVVPSDGSGDLSFTRASDGTRINSAGLVEVCPWNLLEQSETFDNAAWIKSNATITANNTTAPNGTATADKIAANGTLIGSYFAVGESIANNIIGQSYTATLYAKAGTLTQTLMYLGASNGIYWNLSNGQFISYYSGVQNIIAYNSEAVGDGWYKYTISLTASSTTISFESYAAKSGDIYSNYTTADNFFLWGAQLNIGSTAKPYFPTTDRLNVPRLTYQNGGGGCPSLLLEKQSTNVLRNSEDFSQSTWAKLRTSITANAITSPDGTQNADKAIANTDNSDHSVFDNTITSTSPATLSIYAKAGEYNYIFLGYDNGSASQGAFFNLSNGTISQNTSTLTASIQSVGNGWYRCVVSSGTSNWSTIYSIIALSENGTSFIFAGDGSKGIYIWGAQAEVSSYPTSLINTTSSSATRVADACSKTGISSLIGQTEGVLFADVIFLKPEPMFFLSIVGTDWLTDSIYFELSNTTNYIAVSSVKSSTGVGSATSTIAPTANSRYKIAVQYSGTAFNLYINGTKISGTRSANALCSKLYLNELGTLSSTKNNLQTKFNEVVTFTTALSDAECIALTTI